ncbi:hypothetical protein A2803_05170 [Candidatus Woesebacteria bacterium RIFCSPHIGHO2_01_FULL_44_21]|uniref:Ribbon-helix-helix protein CopG domain-containing protein n=1 Tax=Candidatus Woesebacteria bacterium RIFCSPHIGHO2_01_FULL_44_21 TaxID=1802503 RepID=A0A1F7Z2I7_9BACT|nr:MAG: hypothetical protein A2803_05170 [Candidatus Woesebacteria bacterium RIFCSPHIGHO2_01_FULL_44_21]OGM68875.1 MAG: hypothetical protein A2897_01805 [Candidatus Woesebacteria bacterium RIFCSPLOWO2_01_FULL_44_24b]
MATINISIPQKLKEQAQLLVRAGVYSSFSDVVRDSLRKNIFKNKYDLLAEKAKEDYKNGRGVVLKTAKDIDDYFDSL